MLRSHQQRAPLAGTKIEKGKLIELDGQARHHLPKQSRLGRLIRRKKQSQQPRSPAHRATGRVDTMLPVVLHVAIALPPTLGRRLARKAPKVTRQGSTRANYALLPRLLAPPSAKGTPELSGKSSRRHARMLTNHSRGRPAALVYGFASDWAWAVRNPAGSPRGGALSGTLAAPFCIRAATSSRRTGNPPGFATRRGHRPTIGMVSHLGPLAPQTACPLRSVR